MVEVKPRGAIRFEMDYLRPNLLHKETLVSFLTISTIFFAFEEE